MACTRELSITITEEPETEDMPLHSAVYEPGRDKIFAVRGGRVFKFNADTLEKENEVQYAGPTLSDSYITYDSGRDKLWVTYSAGGFRAPPGNQHPTNDKYILKLNTDTLAEEQSIGIGQNFLETSNPSYSANLVMRHLRSNGTQLAFIINAQGASNGVNFVVFNPDSLPFATFTISILDGTGARWGFLDIYPSSTDYLFSTDNQYNDGVVRRTNANVFVEQSETYPNNGNNTTLPITSRIYGFAFCPDNNKHYCANRSNLILRLDATNGFGIGTAIDLGAVVDVWNIRRNPNNGLIYAVDFIGNQIAVIDPSDDSFELKTGFDAPWDVVFTASKAIAIQHSAEGLKEIT